MVVRSANTNSFFSSFGLFAARFSIWAWRSLAFLAWRAVCPGFALGVFLVGHIWVCLKSMKNRILTQNSRKIAFQHASILLIFQRIF